MIAKKGLKGYARTSRSGISGIWVAYDSRRYHYGATTAHHAYSGWSSGSNNRLVGIFLQSGS